MPHLQTHKNLKILVTGPTGYIGGRLVPLLLEKGYSVRCLARNPTNLRDRDWPHVSIKKGSVHDCDSLAKALKGIDIAYYLIHSMGEGKKEFASKDLTGALNFANVAKACRVKRIIYLGGLGNKQQQLSLHLKSRQEVGEILGSTGIPVTEFRAAIIVGSGSISFEMIRYLCQRLPVMLCTKWVRSRCQPIAIRDVLRYLTDAIEQPQSMGQIIEIGGPDVLTYKDMLLQYDEVRGLKRYVIELPILSPRLSAYWVDLVTPIPSSISHALIEGLKNDVICQNNNAATLFPFQTIGYKEAVRLALERIGQGTVQTIWSTSDVVFNTRLIPPLSLENKEGLIIEKRWLWVHARPDKVFKVCAGIGGKRGWYYANWIWTLRGLIDRFFGGIGMRRGRRNPDGLVTGDVLDFWRVEEVKPNRLIRLRAEMKLPGKAWLQFEIKPKKGKKNKCLFIQQAFFEPKGLTGHLYWYLLYPIHQIIFYGLSWAIKKRSEAMNKN